MADAYQAADLF